MASRRDFIKRGGLALAGLTLGKDLIANGSVFPERSIFIKNNFVSKRPNLSDRKFISDAVESKITEVKKNIADEELAWLFEN